MKLFVSLIALLISFVVSAILYLGFSLYQLRPSALADSLNIDGSHTSQIDFHWDTWREIRIDIESFSLTDKNQNQLVHLNKIVLTIPLSHFFFSKDMIKTHIEEVMISDILGEKYDFKYFLNQKKIEFKLPKVLLDPYSEIIIEEVFIGSNYRCEKILYFKNTLKGHCPDFNFALSKNNSGVNVHALFSNQTELKAQVDLKDQISFFIKAFKDSANFIVFDSKIENNKFVINNIEIKAQKDFKLFLEKILKITPPYPIESIDFNKVAGGGFAEVSPTFLEVPIIIQNPSKIIFDEKNLKLNINFNLDNLIFETQGHYVFENFELKQQECFIKSSKFSVSKEQFKKFNTYLNYLNYHCKNYRLKLSDYKLMNHFLEIELEKKDGNYKGKGMWSKNHFSVLTQNSHPVFRFQELSQALLKNWKKVDTFFSGDIEITPTEVLFHESL